MIVITTQSMILGIIQHKKINSKTIATIKSAVKNADKFPWSSEKSFHVCFQSIRVFNFLNKFIGIIISKFQIKHFQYSNFLKIFNT